MEAMSLVERRRAEWNREVLREVLRRWRSCAPGPAGLDGLAARGSVPILCIHYGYASSLLWAVAHSGCRAAGMGWRRFVDRV